MFSLINQANYYSCCAIFGSTHSCFCCSSYLNTPLDISSTINHNLAATDSGMCIGGTGNGVILMPSAVCCCMEIISSPRAEAWFGSIRTLHSWHIGRAYLHLHLQELNFILKSILVAFHSTVRPILSVCSIHLFYTSRIYFSSISFFLKQGNLCSRTTRNTIEIQ